ncbi:MAG: DJ-1/PfpI/YhbO family deglycase/protease [Candidatus Eremiobacteraeota bacterium]|nr:DJ-1/PfpI/YhbO family deglycase/protease [Candidatus Eremiobacteraeota bacterium]
MRISLFHKAWMVLLFLSLAAPLSAAPEAFSLPGCLSDSGVKKVVFIIAQKDFRDEEYKIPSDMLKAKGAQVKVASAARGEASGMLGLRVNADLALKEVTPNDYDAVVFVGGPGAQVFFNDREAHRIARETASKGKVLAAICLAPSILARAGVLKGKKATVFESESATLTGAGARYTSSQVVQDGLVITADGPEGAKKFGELIVKALY